MPRPKRDVHRIAVTVPRDVHEVWRAAAVVKGQSLSSLVAEFLEQLSPLMKKQIALAETYEAATAEQQEALRIALIHAANVAETQLTTGWEPVQLAIDGLDVEDEI